MKPLPLKNFGNTCYLNTILQTLFVCDVFNYFILQESSDESFIQCYKALYMLFKEGDSQQINLLIPKFTQFASNLFKLRKQQDACEIIFFILNEFHVLLPKKFDFEEFIAIQRISIPSLLLPYCKSKFNSLYTHDYSTISAIFSGQTFSLLNCCNCKKQLNQIEKFTQLILPIHDHIITNLEDALQLYFQKEYVESTNCERCDTKRMHTKKLYLLGVPYYLIIVFNRFENNGSHIKKNTRFIDFTHDLNLVKYFFSTNKSKEKISASYKLKSIINHSGNLQSGHYWCFQKYANKWYKCNDTSISEVAKIDENIKQNAYILVYGLLV